jgi:hypothetical protein
MSFAEYVWTIVQKKRRQGMDRLTLARCFRKVKISKRYHEYSSNLFVVRMAEEMNSMVGDAGKITALNLHVAVYFGNHYTSDDYQTRILKAFAQAAFYYFNKCVSCFANLKDPSVDLLNMMWLSSRRLEEVYKKWYEAQTKLCVLGCDVVRKCGDVINRLMFSTLRCVMEEYWLSASYMLEAVNRLCDLNERIYGVMVFEEHVDDALRAEVKLHSNYEACFQSVGVHALRHVKLKYEAREYDEDEDKNRTIAFRLVRIVKELCDLRSQSRWIEQFEDYHKVVEETKKSRVLLEPDVELFKERTEVEAEIAFLEGLLRHMEWMYKR